MEFSWANPDLIHNTFVREYSQYETESDVLGFTWTKEELKELGSVYAVVAAGLDIKQHLSGYPANPAGAVAYVLPKVSPEDIIHRNERAPVISRSKSLFALQNEPCKIRASIEVESGLGLLILQRSQGDSFGGEWEFPGGKINADENIVEGSVRELGEETGLECPIQLRSFAILEGGKNNLKLYQFNSSAKVEGNKPGWERRIRLSEEHQGFAWITRREWNKFAPGREKDIQEGLERIVGKDLLQPQSGQ
ncbi:hypothetical protein BDV09DRAFT_200890 [Aspergillus tetrazonus]